MKNASIFCKWLINIGIIKWLKNKQFNGIVVFTGVIVLCQTFIHKVIHRKCGKNGFFHTCKELASLCVEFTLTMAFNWFAFLFFVVLCLRAKNINIAHASITHMLGMQLRHHAFCAIQ